MNCVKQGVRSKKVTKNAYAQKLTKKIDDSRSRFLIEDKTKILKTSRVPNGVKTNAFLIENLEPMTTERIA